MKRLVIIPTYNELENIVNIVLTVLKLRKDYHVLIIDDNSPDGTGKVADDLTRKHDEVFVIHRPKKEGLGPAYIEGFKWALERGYELIFEMDADFSHNPEHLLWFEKEIPKYDLVIGSRYVKIGGTINWSKYRILISRLGNLYARIITGMPFSDLTSGFKCFQRGVLELIDLDKIKSKGYAFQIETTYRAYKRGFRVKEIPIIFHERRVGKSKLSRQIVFEAVWKVIKLRLGF